MKTNIEIAHMFTYVENDIKEISGSNVHIVRNPYDKNLLEYRSYNTPIVIRDIKADIYLVSTDTYSVTTSKHQRDVINAIWAQKIFVPNVNNDINSNVRVMMDDIKKLSIKHLRALKNSYESEINHIIENMINYLDYGKVDKRKYRKYYKLSKMTFDDIIKSFSSANDKELKAKKAAALKRKKRDAKARKNAIIEIKKQLPYIMRLISLRNKTFESNHVKTFDSIVKKLNKVLVFIKQYNLSDYEYLFETIRDLNKYTVLRVTKNDNVTTSQHVTISKKSAALLYDAVERKIGIVGYVIDGYKVRSMDDKNIVIGCHNILLSDIDKAAKKLGLI